jgi:hypothetical protein
MTPEVVHRSLREQPVPRGEAAVPVDRLGVSTAAVEALTLPATEALSVVYRDDIHLTAGAAINSGLTDV